MDKNKIKNILDACLMFILFFYSWVFQVIPVLLFDLDLEKLSPKMKVCLSAFASIMLAVILFLIYRKELIEEWKKFKDNFWKNFDIGLNAWFKGLIAMVIFNTLLNILFKAGTANNEQSVQSMINTLPWMMLIMSGIFAPITEEIVLENQLEKYLRIDCYIY